MPIDLQARQKLAEYQRQKALSFSLGSIQDSIFSLKDYTPAIRLLEEQINDVNERLSSGTLVLSEKVLEGFKKSQESLEQLQKLHLEAEKKQSELTTEQGQQIKDLLSVMEEKLTEINKVRDQISAIKIPEAVDIKTIPAVEVKNFPKPDAFPKSMEVYGNVGVTEMPPVMVSNLKDLEKTLSDLQKTTLQVIQSQKVDFPKGMEISNEVKIDAWNDLLLRIDETNKGLNLLLNQEKTGASKVEVMNFPIPKIPTPVTNISINPLQGFVHTTQNSVGTSVTALPNYGQLFNRRSLQIYNNTATTIYIGGSDVTTSNGIPVPANSYSSIIDAGYRMIVYAIAASPVSDIRCLEVSHDQTNNVQE